MKKTILCMIMLLTIVLLACCDSGPKPSTTGLLSATLPSQTLVKPTTPTTKPPIPTTKPTVPQVTEGMPSATTLPTPTIPETEVDPSCLQYIYESPVCTHCIEKCNYKNKILSDQLYMDERVPKAKNIVLFGEEYEVVYQYSIHYWQSDDVFHYYTLSDNPEFNLILREDDSVYQIDGPILKIDIDTNSSEDAVISAWESATAAWFTPDAYQNVTVKQSTSGNYTLMYFNETAGYQTNYVRIVVDCDGTLSFMRIHDHNMDGIKLSAEDYACNIDHELENAIIAYKMKDLYNTDQLQYVSHAVLNATFTVYENELFVAYSIDVEFIDYELPHWETCQILIPIRLIVSE